MSDTFWIVLGGILSLVLKDILDQRRAERIAKQNRLIAADLHVNTIETITNRKAVEDYDSASRHIGEEAADAAKVAAKLASSVAIQSVVATQRVLDQTKEIVKGQDQLKEQLNGGPEGLGQRIAKNEARLDGLEKGLGSVIKSIDDARMENVAVAKAVEKMLMEFSSFSAEYKFNHPHPKEG